MHERQYPSLLEWVLSFCFFEGERYKSMFFIRKVLNNSAAIVFDDSKKEYLILGKGMVFGKRQNDEIEPSNATRVIPLTKENRTRLEELVREIPYSYFQISEEIKLLAEKELQQKLDDDILLHLADHIYYAVQKYQKNILVPNMVLNETKVFYPKEFKASQQAIKLINKTFDTKFDDNEAGFISFHIVNSEYGNSNIDLNRSIDFIKEMLAMTEEYFHVSLDVGSVPYYRFVTHLKFMSTRLFSTEHEHPVDMAGDGLYEMLKKQYHNIYRFLDEVSQMTEKKYEYKLSDSDRIYLIIHLARVLKKRP